MSANNLIRPVVLTALSFSLFALTACSDDPVGDGGTGGAAATGGAGTGGAGTGGVGTGGVGTGGAGTGGSGTGGVGTGGAGTGGSGTGGVGTGGAGTGGDGTGGDGTGGDGTGGAAGEFTLTSTAFMDGDAIPSTHTCAGGGGQMNWGTAPPLEWTGIPDGTMSFAFFMIDETLTTKSPPDVNGNHSGAWNIPATITSLPEGFTPSDLGGAEAINGGYLGPCPNLITQGNTDTYNMIVLAMPMATYTVSGTGTAGVRDAYAMLKADALGEAILSGTSDAVMGGGN